MLRLSTYGLTKARKSSAFLVWNKTAEYQNWYQILSVCSSSRLTPGVCLLICMSRRISFAQEESKAKGSSILKLTGPFGNNHQMCHGKTATSWCKGRQEAASINIFPLRLATDVVLTELILLTARLRVIFHSFFFLVKVCCWRMMEISHPNDPTCNMTDNNRDNREEEHYQCHLLQIGSSGN